MTQLLFDPASAVPAVVGILNLYGVAIDSRRWDLLDDIFLPHVRLEYFGTRWDNLASFRRDFAEAHEHFTATQHMICNHVVRQSTDGMSALSYCRWRLERAGVPGGDSYAGTAWYDDRLVLTDAGWRISDRTCGIIWVEGNPAVAGAARLPDHTPLHAAARAGELRFFVPPFPPLNPEQAGKA